MEKTASIYVIEDSIAQLFAMRDEVATEEERAAIDGQIEAWASAEVSKVDGVRAWLKHCQQMRTAAGDEAARLRDLAKLWEAREERMEHFVIAAMERSGKKKLEGKTGSLTVQGNGGLAPLDVYDESIVPPEFFSYTIKMDYEQWRQVERWFSAVLGKPARTLRGDLTRAELEQPCEMCAGAGNGGYEQLCEACAGSGKRGVPGARLLDRGVHLRVK